LKPRCTSGGNKGHRKAWSNSTSPIGAGLEGVETQLIECGVAATDSEGFSQDKSVSKVLTLASIKSRTTRYSFGGRFIGSGMFQSARDFARTYGHSSPQPMVTTKSY